MYVGHSLLALALGAGLARHLGVRRSRVLLVGILAGGFALLPDVDTTYTVYAVVRAGPENLFPTPQYVWTAEAWRVHRALTHSLLVGAVASAGVLALGLAHAWGAGGSKRQARPRRRGGALVALALAAVAFGAILATGYTTDALAGLTTAGFYVAGALVLAGWAVRRDVGPRWLGLSAAVGLLTHPFGDLFMGRPPAFLYPVVTEPPIQKLSVAADPTVNLVALFLLEVGLAWAVVRTVATERGWRIRTAVEPVAVLALGFAGAALFLRPPTLQVAYHFAIGTLATGLVLGVAPGVVRDPLGAEGRRFDARTSVVTALAAVTLALVAYLLAYVVLGPPA